MASDKFVPEPAYEDYRGTERVDFREMEPMVITDEEQDWMLAHHGPGPWPDHWLVDGRFAR